MARRIQQARTNPRGLHAQPQGLPTTSWNLDEPILVLVGKHGKFTHLYDPVLGTHACQSGKNAGRGGPSGAKSELYPTEAKTITCYRCAKLALMNRQRTGSIVPRAKSKS